MEEALHILCDQNQAADNRLNALLVIVDRFEEDHLPVFEEILNNPDEDADVRSAVALSLGKIANPLALKLLIHQATSPNATSQNPVLRDYIMQALGMSKQAEAVPVLVEALKDQDNKVFASAAEALGKLGELAVPALITLLDEGADDARCVAAWKLGEIRPRKAIEPLLHSIEKVENIDYIALAIWALGEIGISTTEVTEALVKAKQHPEPEVYLRAEVALKKVARHTN
jgi:HEAT repeat protein